MPYCKRYIIFMTLLYATSLLASEYQQHFGPEEFSARREKVFDKIGSDAAAILQAAPGTGGFIYPRQTNSFYYLCGVENPHSYLVLDGRSRKTILYLQKSRDRGWDRVLNTENTERARQLTGVDEVITAEQLTELDAKVIYTPFRPAEGHAQSRGGLRSRNRQIARDYWDGRSSREENFLELLKKRHPNAEIKDLSPILDELRSIKSPGEIALLRKAGQLAALGLFEAMRSTEEGIYEYQLEAPAKYIFQMNGARFDAYQSITASGVKNISDSHYYYKSCILKDGDLVLMDYSPDCGYYVSDIGRMWPVNGKFQKWQRQLCQFILDYHKEIIQRIRPGATVRDIMSEARKAMEPKLKPIYFSKPEHEKAARRLIERGGGVFSHTVGMAVHDVGRYRSEPLKPGQVFSIDPQLRVPEENLYMRIEDTVVVTEDGVEILTNWAPWELDEIEKLVQEKGMLQKVPPRFVCPKEYLEKKGSAEKKDK